MEETEWDYLREYEDEYYGPDYYSEAEAWFDDGEGVPAKYMTPAPTFWEKVKAEVAYLKSLIFPRVEPAYHYMLEDEIPF